MTSELTGRQLRRRRGFVLKGRTHCPRELPRAPALAAQRPGHRRVGVKPPLTSLLAPLPAPSALRKAGVSAHALPECPQNKPHDTAGATRGVALDTRQSQGFKSERGGSPGISSRVWRVRPMLCRAWRAGAQSGPGAGRTREEPGAGWPLPGPHSRAAGLAGRTPAAPLAARQQEAAGS